MAININEETVVPIRDVPKWCQENLGTRVHLSTAHRWRLRGARGVKLETLLIGGSRVTSAEALARFFAATTAAADHTATPNPVSILEQGTSVADAHSYLAGEGIL